MTFALTLSVRQYWNLQQRVLSRIFTVFPFTISEPNESSFNPLKPFHPQNYKYFRYHIISKANLFSLTFGIRTCLLITSPLMAQMQEARLKESRFLIMHL